MKQVFSGFGCAGENQSPQLSWSNAPEGTKSYSITLFDPDAPSGSGWWLWVVFDIPADGGELAAGAGTPGWPGMPAGAMQNTTDLGGPGYGGPCPPTGHGPHQHVLTLHALKVDNLGLDAKASAPMVGFNLSQKTLAKASIVFYYERRSRHYETTSGPTCGGSLSNGAPEIQPGRIPIRAMSNNAPLQRVTPDQVP